jgi:iron-sulfur cluster insertion protein
MAPDRAPGLGSAAQHVTHRFDAPSPCPYTHSMSEAATLNPPEEAQHAAHSEPALLIFTDAAAHKVGELIAGEGNPKLMLRVFVQGGGCSGLQYGFEFDEVLQEGDTCVENQGVKLLIDPMSFQYLGGAEIDYREGLDGAQFVIRNPNAQTTCGCGSSFSA